MAVIDIPTEGPPPTRNKCEDSPPKGGSRDERADVGRKDPPELENAAALR